MRIPVASIKIQCWLFDLKVKLKLRNMAEMSV